MTLDELAGLAKAATMGPWRASTDERYGYFVSGSALDWIADMGKTNQAGIDAEYIAACDPGTVLKLIAVAKASQTLFTELNGGGAVCDYWKERMKLRDALTALESP